MTISDGLRRKNLCGGQVHVHWLPTWLRDADDRIIGLRHVMSHWRGDDAPHLRLKEQLGADGNFRDRPRDILPGIVDLRLFFLYWSDVREHDLRGCGLLGTHDRLDLETEHFALFVSPRGRQRRERRRVASTPSDVPYVGQATDAGFANWFVDGYFECVRHTVSVLQTVDPTHPMVPDDFPRTPREARAGRWAGLFTPHKVRWLGGTWFYGILDNRKYAEEYTNDSLATIQAHYSKVPPAIERLLGCGDVRDAMRFKTIIDLMIATRHQALDWSAFWDAWQPLQPVQDDDPDAWMRLLLGPAPAVVVVAPVKRRGGRRGIYSAGRPRSDDPIEMDAAD